MNKQELVGAERVYQALRDCIGPDIPLPIREVVSWKTKGSETIAQVITFDGQPSTLVVSTWGHLHGWTLEWRTKSKMAIAWNGKEWERCSLDLSEE